MGAHDPELVRAATEAYDKAPRIDLLRRAGASGPLTPEDVRDGRVADILAAVVPLIQRPGRYDTVMVDDIRTRLATVGHRWLPNGRRWTCEEDIQALLSRLGACEELLRWIRTHSRVSEVWEEDAIVAKIDALLGPEEPGTPVTKSGGVR